MHTGSRTSAFPRDGLQLIVRGKKEPLQSPSPRGFIPTGTQRVFGFPNVKTSVFHCRGRPRDFRLALRVRAIGATRERFTALAIAHRDTLTSLRFNPKRVLHVTPRANAVRVHRILHHDSQAIRESPLIGRDGCLYTEIQKFGKEEYFCARGLTILCCVARRAP